MDFTHLSERVKFFSIHNKLKDKVLNHVQIWVKIISEREIFPVQRFFDQLILTNNKFPSIKIATKK